MADRACLNYRGVVREVKNVREASAISETLGGRHHMETVAVIQEGMASAERGELKPATQVLEEMHTRYGLSVSAADSV